MGGCGGRRERLVCACSPSARLPLAGPAQLVGAGRAEPHRLWALGGVGSVEQWVAHSHPASERPQLAGESVLSPPHACCRLRRGRALQSWRRGR